MSGVRRTSSAIAENQLTAQGDGRERESREEEAEGKGGLKTMSSAMERTS